MIRRNIPLRFSFFHNRNQLILSNPLPPATLYDLQQKLFPQRKQKVDRREDNSEYIDKRHGKHCERFRILLCQRLRRDFTEDENNDRHHNGGNCRSVRTIQYDKKHGRDSSISDISNIIPNQNRRQKLIVPPDQFQHHLRSFIAVIGHVLQTDPVR